MVEYFGSQLSLLVSSSRVERIVKDEAIGTLVRSQIFQVPTDDPLSYQNSEAKPVDMWVLHESIVGVFGEASSTLVILLLHVHASVSKHITEDV